MAEERVVYLVVGANITAEDRHFLPPKLDKVFVMDGVRARDVEGTMRALGMAFLPRIAVSVGMFTSLPHQSVAFGSLSHLAILTAAAVNWATRRARGFDPSDQLYTVENTDPENIPLRKMPAMNPDYPGGICSVRLVRGQVASVWPVICPYPTAA